MRGRRRIRASPAAMADDQIDGQRIIASRRIYDPRRWSSSSTPTRRRRSSSSGEECSSSSSGSGNRGGGQAPAGWVGVWAGRFKRWRRRWFVAHPAGLLLYYKNSDQIGRPGCINLLGARIVPDMVKPRQIKIVRGPIVYYLRTTNKDVRQGWLDAISESVRIYNKSLRNVAVCALPRSSLPSDSCANLKEECKQQEKELNKRLDRHLRDIEPTCEVFLQKLRDLQQSLLLISETLGFSATASSAPSTEVAEIPSTPKTKDRITTPRSIFGRRAVKHKKGTLQNDNAASGTCRRSSSCPIETLDSTSVPLSRKRMSSDSDIRSKQDLDATSCVAGLGYIDGKKPVIQGPLHAAWNDVQEAYAEALREEIRRVIELEAENLVLQDSLAMLPQLQKDRAALLELREKLKKDGFYSEGKDTEIKEGETADSDDDISIVATELTNEEYFEALEVINQHDFIAKSMAPEEQEICTDVTQEPPEEGELDMLSEAEVEEVDQPRTRLPAPRPLSMGFSLWTVLKNAIGKDLNHITMPATINEPLSALQRCAEQMQFRYLLQSAAEQESSMERLLLVASFACAYYHGSILRDAKPFNPMLGETYEWQAYDGSSRFITEQVSHHPPVMAFQADAPGELYSLYGELEIKNKFWGKSVEVLPVGKCHVRFPKFEDHFTWNQVTTCIHNIVMGKPWIDSYGDMTIKNHRTGEYARIRFHKASSTEQGRVSGKVYDSQGTALFNLCGNYMDKISVSSEPRTSENGAGRCLWESPAKPHDYKQQYCFSQFAIGLNELTSKLARALPPTDSRFRPDQRALEDGNLEKATPEKFRLEEKQRQSRKLRKEKGVEWKSQWFDQTIPGKAQPSGDAEDLEPNWKYNGKYWDSREHQAWNQCPDIM